jgi:hypothetical protein
MLARRNLCGLASSRARSPSRERRGADPFVPADFGPRCLCEHLFALTSKGSIAGQLQRAIAARDLLAVRSLAAELPEVPLATAAEITMLLLEREPHAYAPAARRLLSRLASERVMALRQLGDVAAILAELECDPAMSARGKLIQLVREAPRSRT